MTKQLFQAIPLFAALALGTACSGCNNEAAPDQTASANEDIIVDPVGSLNPQSPGQAAAAFLNALNDTQRGTATYAFDAPERSGWSNLPSNLVKPVRAGIRLGDLTSAQLYLALRLIDTLSVEGSSLVRQIVAADRVLKPRDKDGRMGWSSSNYWLAIYGDPATPQWGWSLGGHHLAFNVSIKGQAWTLSPTFLGVEPGSFELNGQLYTPLKAQVDQGLALMQSLDPQQQLSATIPERPREVITGPGEDATIPPVQGIKLSSMGPDQAAKLMGLISLWTKLLPKAQATLNDKRIGADRENLHFAWHGAPDGSGAIYYRIQGSDLIIEFSTQGAVGAAQGTHYHSVYRVPSLQYGRY